MKNLLYILNIFALAALLIGCQKDGAVDSSDMPLYIIADLGPSDPHPDDPKNVLTKVSYTFSEHQEGEEPDRILARWEEDDIIKVYPTNSTFGTSADIYSDYSDYRRVYPYPAAPMEDRYYRFRCVGGVGTTHGVFKYMGLATARIVEDPVTNIRNVEVDIARDHKIPNWDRFQGVVVYGNPLRNIMMRRQSKDNDMSHLKYGQRMYGYMCAHDFQSWFDGHNQTTEGSGAEGLVMHNIGSCVYRFLLGGFDRKIYGGCTLTFSVPGVTDDKDTVDINGNQVRNQPMSLTLGNANDYQSGVPAWCDANTDGSPHTEENTITAYVVGWPGTFRSGTTAVVTLDDPVSATRFTWNLPTSSNIVFQECCYFTFDLRDRIPTKTPLP